MCIFVHVVYMLLFLDLIQVPGNSLQVVVIVFSLFACQILIVSISNA